jgi:hypothetical protein
MLFSAARSRKPKAVRNVSVHDPLQVRVLDRLARLLEKFEPLRDAQLHPREVLRSG